MSPNISKWVRKFRKYHKWPGIFVSLFALLFALSGIILNHREIISNVDISRKLMPPGYQYNNWNLASVRSSLTVGNDSVLLYGNIGAWIVTESLSSFHDYNSGFPEGIDKRKIYSIVKYKDHVIAGTHFGLFERALKRANWQQIAMPEEEERITDLTVRGDSLLVLTRNYLYSTTDLVHLDQIKLPPPIGYKHKSGLFLTLWELHSGELFGLIGKFFVDLLGIVLLFLTITGLLHFLFPKWISRLKRRQKTFATPLAMKKINLKWHNLIGYVFVAFLIVNVTAGMFLRPPLLIPISSAQVAILPFSHLDTDNPWHDKLRRVIWNEVNQKYLFNTSDGFFQADRELKKNLELVAKQPPVSIMGCNILEPLTDNRFLVGSFSGLFIWNTVTGESNDFFTGARSEEAHGIGRPVGQNMAAGFVKDTQRNSYWFDYNLGAIAINHAPTFPAMPAVILKNSPVSLWNAALEVHTGRIFEHLIGPFYLLYVPLMGLSILVVLISGFLIWWLAYHKNKVTKLN